MVACGYWISVFCVLMRYRIERLKTSIIFTRANSLPKNYILTHQANPFPMACLQFFKRGSYRSEPGAVVQWEISVDQTLDGVI